MQKIIVILSSIIALGIFATRYEVAQSETSMYKNFATKEMMVRILDKMDKIEEKIDALSINLSRKQ